MGKIFAIVCRLFLGIVFLVAGINGYLVIFNLEPFIQTSPEAMALFEFKYLLIMEKTLEILCGMFLIMNQFVPLVISILSPIVINILFLHIFLDHSLLPLAVILLLALVYLLFCYRKNFIGIIERKPFPDK
ncbi:hypothetical protein [Sediminibacillus massiliensis]|uniref:hypothetical protein n=1 Tax=Sediminibacillus massiliensis TaxID=1926277 RepID=UPI0009884D68|nr:hypothetical protein [Sediminibacillus massiliensis]